MAGRVRYNKDTGSYEFTQPEQTVVETPSVTGPANEIKSAEQMDAERKAATQGDIQKESQKDLIDVDALKQANEANITAQKKAAETAQASQQSAIDAFGKQVEAWQNEYDAEKQAAEDAEKRAKTNTLISSIADGLTAMSNIYFASQGAPSQKLYSGTQKYMDIYARARDRREQLQREINRKLESGNLNLAQMRAEKIAAKAKSDAAIAKAESDAQSAVISAQAKNQQYQEEKDNRERKYQDALKQQELENKLAERRVKASEQNADTRTANSIKYTGTGSGTNSNGSGSKKSYIIGGQRFSEEDAAAMATKYYYSRAKEIEDAMANIEQQTKKPRKDPEYRRLEAEQSALTDQWEKAMNSQAGKANFIQNNYVENDDDFLGKRKVSGGASTDISTDELSKWEVK